MVNENTLPMALPESFETGDYRPPRERLLCVPGHNAGAGGLPCSGHALEIFHALSYLPVFTSENVHNPENIKGVLILWRKTSML